MLRCLHCHSVFDDQRSRFSELVASLQEVGQFVDTSTCVEMAKGEAPIDGTYFHLSFDDGFKNNFTNARPVLSELDIPAIFFVPSNFISAEWADEHTYSRDITGHAGVLEMMDWKNIAELVHDGFEIGSHTQTHARLTDLDGENLKREIFESKLEIEERTGRACKYISWPYGGADDIQDEALDLVKEAGYEACFSGMRGTVQPNKTNLFRIPRHHFQPHWLPKHVHYFAYRY